MDWCFELFLLVVLSYLLRKRFQRRNYVALLAVATVVVSIYSALGWIEVPPLYNQDENVIGFALPFSFPFLAFEVFEPISAIFRPPVLPEISAVQINFVSFRLGELRYAPQTSKFIMVIFWVFLSFLSINIVGAIIGYWIESNTHIQKLLRILGKVKPRELRNKPDIMGYLVFLGLFSTCVSFLGILRQNTSEVVYGFLFFELMRIGSSVHINVLNFFWVATIYFAIYSDVAFWFFRIRFRHLSPTPIWVELTFNLAILIFGIEEILFEMDAIKSGTEHKIALFFLILAIMFLIVDFAWMFEGRRRTPKVKEKEERKTMPIFDREEDLYRRVLEAYLSTVGGGVQRFEMEIKKIEKQGLTREQALQKMAEKLEIS